jgi:hypothetical protein
MGLAKNFGRFAGLANARPIAGSLTPTIPVPFFEASRR